MKEHEILNEINKVKKIMTMTRVVGVLMIIAILVCKFLEVNMKVAGTILIVVGLIDICLVGIPAQRKMAKLKKQLNNK